LDLKCDILNCTYSNGNVDSTDYNNFSTCVNENYNNKIYKISRGGESCRYSKVCEFDINNNNICTCGDQSPLILTSMISLK